MGSISQPYTPHPDGFTAYVQQNLLAPGETLLRSAAGTKGLFYAAIQNPGGQVSGLALSYVFGYNTNPGGTLGIIHVTRCEEGGGPRHRHCPERVLNFLDDNAPLPDLKDRVKERIAAIDEHLNALGLSPQHATLLRAEHARLDPHRGARTWRADCRKNLGRTRTLGALQAGDLIHLESEIRFVSGLKTRHFYLHRKETNSHLALHHNHTRCSVGRWRNQAFTVTKRGDATEQQKAIAGMPGRWY